ncbi:hypothetical protein vBRpoSV10_41 [Ruegeria phage vB_RpoS-V10]|nr:hypothetical protein vBRpoSV10_41 [Ruegeria phage vB_RpoS-V10]
MTPNMISAVEAFALTVMAGPYSSIPCIMSGQAVPEKAKTYVRFWVIPSEDVMPIGLGEDAKSRNVGIVQVDVYGPKDKGAGQTGNIAEYIRKQFHRLPLAVGSEGWVVFKDAGVKDMGDLGEEHRQMMRVPYRYDFKTA